MLRSPIQHRETIPMTTTSAPTTETFRVVGMSCRHCEMAVSAELSNLPGVISVAVDVAAGTATTNSERALARQDVAAAIDDAGYELA
jgi:copper chaperone CopZ